MVLKEMEFDGNRTPNQLREIVKEAEKSTGRKATYLVGTKCAIGENTIKILLPKMLQIMKSQKLHFAAASLGLDTGVLVVTLNILPTKYLHENHSCLNFGIKQDKYKCDYLYVLEDD